MTKIYKILFIVACIVSASIGGYAAIVANTPKTHNLPYSGMSLNVEGAFIDDKLFLDMPVGLTVWANKATVANCSFINCSDEGLLLLSEYNYIKNCLFVDCLDGVELQESSHNVFVNCYFINCSHMGIDGIKRNNNHNLFKNCIFFDCDVDYYFRESYNNTFIDCWSNGD